MWIYLGIMTTAQSINSSEAYIFRNVALICLGVGGVSSLVFHLTVKVRSHDETNQNATTLNTTNNADKKLDSEDMQRPASFKNMSTEVTKDISVPQDISSQHQDMMTIKDWFSEPQFYQIGCLYMFTRLFVNLTQVFIPFYLQITLQLKAMYVAVIPLVMYLSGAANRLFHEKCNKTSW